MRERQLITRSVLRLFLLCAGAAAVPLTGCAVDRPPHQLGESNQRSVTATRPATVIWASDGDALAAAQSQDGRELGILSSHGAGLQLTNVLVPDAKATWKIDLSAGSAPAIQSMHGRYVVTRKAAAKTSVTMISQQSGKVINDCLLPSDPVLQEPDLAWIGGEAWSLHTCQRTGARLLAQPAMASQTAVALKRGALFEVRALSHPPVTIAGNALDMTTETASFTTEDKFCVLSLRSWMRHCIPLTGELAGFRHVQGSSPSDDRYAILTADGVLQVTALAATGFSELRRWDQVSDLNDLSADSVLFGTGGHTEWRRLADDAAIAQIPEGALPLYAEGDTAVLSQGKILLARVQ